MSCALRCADRVRHPGAPRSERLRRTDSRVAGGLVLHLGVELGAQQDHDRGNPKPGHEADHHPERAVGLVEGAEVRPVP